MAVILYDNCSVMTRNDNRRNGMLAYLFSVSDTSRDIYISVNWGNTLV